jgi:glycosyltransferase involved in cell wall biosynthesis
VDVEVNKYEMKRSLGLNAEGLVVGTVGWLLPIKGPKYLLDAMILVWKKHADTSLVFVGKGELEEELRKETFQMGASDKVKFLGWRDDIPEVMQVFDVFVLPSLNEGMGRVLVEAMAAGKPIVASNVGGIPDLVQHGQNGFLVDPADSKSLSFSIMNLLGDKNMRIGMGKRGKAIASDFSVEKMIEKMGTLYSSLCH